MNAGRTVFAEAGKRAESGTAGDARRVVATAFAMTTPYGSDAEACFSGLMAGRCALSPVERFDTSAFRTRWGGTVPDLMPEEGASLALTLLERTLERMPPAPEEPLLLATTTGEADRIERAVSAGRREDFREGALHRLLERVCERWGVRDGTVVSAACVSSTAALAQAASMIRAGEAEAITVVGVDALTEFVFAGFSSLMALDPDRARPFDARRAGLSVGEGAAAVRLTSLRRARREGAEPLGEILGQGLSNDANHVTGPSRDGEGLARAIALALRSAGLPETTVGHVCAHGTGTRYNDNMEMLAFRRVFSSPRPTWSPKGGMGHSMGATGLVEAILTWRALAEGRIPPTVGLEEPDAPAEGWVSDRPQPIDGPFALSVNSGFGGTNAALLLGLPAEGGAA